MSEKEKLNEAEAKKTRSSKEMISLGLILALYASISCAVLALVNNFTAPKILKNQEVKVSNSMEAFFPGDGYKFEKADGFSGKTVGSIKVESIVLAVKDGEVEGGAAQVTGPTYDQGTIFVGMTKDGTVKGLKFLKLSDSPGFGLKANDSTFVLPNGKTFYGQFEGKSASSGFTAGENFDAISGATITSKAVGELINVGTQTLFEVFSSEGEVSNE